MFTNRAVLNIISPEDLRIECPDTFNVHFSFSFPLSLRVSTTATTHLKIILSQSLIILTYSSLSWKWSSKDKKV